MLKVFCPISKGPVITSSNKIINQFEQEVALGKKNVRASCLPKGQAEVFFGALNQDTTTSVCVGYAHASALCLETSLKCYLRPV